MAMSIRTSVVFAEGRTSSTQYTPGPHDEVLLALVWHHAVQELADGGRSSNPRLLEEGVHHLALASSLLAALDSPCQSSLLVWSYLAR